VPPHARRVVAVRFLAGHVPYLAAIGIAFVSPVVSLGLIGAVALYYVFENTPTTSPAEPVRNAPPGT